MNNGHIFFDTKDYAVLDLLGKGGFACVYRARCKSNGVEVAIKMVSCLNKFHIYLLKVKVSVTPLEVYQQLISV